MIHWRREHGWGLRLAPVLLPLMGSMACDDSTSANPESVTASSSTTSTGTTSADSSVSTTTSLGAGGMATTASTTVNGGFSAVSGSTGSLPGSECEGLRGDVALDEVTPLGFSAEQILAFAAGSHESRLVYGLDNFTGVPLSFPEPTTITLTIEPAGTASFVADALINGLCNDVVEIDVAVTLSTADGSFDEELSTRLLVEDASRAHIQDAIDLESLQGSFALDRPDAATFHATKVSIIVGDGFSVGDISGEIENCRDDGCSLGTITYAQWNDGDCQRGAIPVDATNEGESVMADTLERVNALSPLAITWGNGAKSQLALEVSSQSATLCHHPAGALSMALGDEYWFNAELSLSSEDDRLQTTLPIGINAVHDDNGAPLSIFLDNFETGSPVETSAFEATYGLKDVAFNEATNGQLYFYLRLEYGAGLSTPNSVVGALDVLADGTVLEPIAIGALE